MIWIGDLFTFIKYGLVSKNYCPTIFVIYYILHLPLGNYMLGESIHIKDILK